jgi:hypothetical protein
MKTTVLNGDAVLKLTDEDGTTALTTWAEFAEANKDTPEVTEAVARLYVGCKTKLGGGAASEATVERLPVDRKLLRDPNRRWSERVCDEGALESVPLDIWVHGVDEDTGKETGYLRRFGFRLVKDVAADLAVVLDKMIDEYISCAVHGDACATERVREYRWIACYAVTGGSEGHYVHVDLVGDIDDRGVRPVQPVAVVKTFQGMAHAYAIAARCAEVLGA